MLIPKPFPVFTILFFLLLAPVISAKTPGPKAQWQTLTGQQPLVIARGGFSGTFPESSGYANQLAVNMGIVGSALYCNLQISKDGEGFCLTDIALNNSTNIAQVYPKGKKTYNVNGVDVEGWFAVDYTANQLLNNVSLTQSTFSRPNIFDGTLPLSTVEDALGAQASKFWINVEHDMFFTQHNASISAYLERALKMFPIDYISSSEMDFLKTIKENMEINKTKLVFKVEDTEAQDPSNKQKYGKLVNNLGSIKTFASGIIVPKNMIWPVNKDRYLEPATTLVTDAHKEGLEVYAYGFANDFPISYNYSYDPNSEYLQFIDNSQFSVDGLLTDFPITASAAIGCLAHNKNGRSTEGLLIISHNGASGTYAGSTDLAYEQAVADGADIIDCVIQMSKDGVAFCHDSPDLIPGTTAATSTFMAMSTTVTEIQANDGVFSFDLTWNEIQTLKPQLTSPIPQSSLQRNPAYKNSGKFITLQNFLEFAKNNAVSGILISIENAAYLASKKGLDVTGMVADALTKAKFHNQGKSQKVLIQSDDSSVLSSFKGVTSYKRVLRIENKISHSSKQVVNEIKKHADAVSIPRSSVIQTSDFFTTKNTSVVQEFQAANISVYVSVFRNEFTAIALDFFSDPMVELATYFLSLNVDGIITDYPMTASTYFRSLCSDLRNDAPYHILPVQIGSMISLAPTDALPPAEAPVPELDVGDVVDPPLPPVVNISTSITSPPAPAPLSPHHPSSTPSLPTMTLALLEIVTLTYFLPYIHAN